jgi:hypothetical protein
VGARIFQISVNKINLGHRRARLLIADLHKINRSRGWTRRGPGVAPRRRRHPWKSGAARAIPPAAVCRIGWRNPPKTPCHRQPCEEKATSGFCLPNCRNAPRFHAKCQKAPAHTFTTCFINTVYLTYLFIYAGWIQIFRMDSFAKILILQNQLEKISNLKPNVTPA